ncbi:MAG TPA: 50S ribosomal protein L23 [Candidatus Saccharimonadales bacterium]|jgi:ribosomal protein L23|nr:50S ribosomal protein L23 [Candidatus Saccharimonadales bacterium]
MSNSIFLKPRLSEKAYQSIQQNNVYIFTIDKSINRKTIKQSVESQFSVTVVSVRIGYLPGKNKHSVLKASHKNIYGTTSSVKKAYVTLKKGDSIPIFAVEEAEKERQDKLAKTLSKGKK